MTKLSDSGTTLSSVWEWFRGAPFHVLTILLVAFIIAWIGKRAIKRVVKRLSNTEDENHQRRRERALTTGSILNSSLNAGIFVVATVMVLGELGLNVAPIIASASVLGLAVSLGAQNIVKDLVSGIFMLFEDQYGVGDVISASDVEGVVENVGLRVTTVRSADGTLWYLRNGEILKVGNKSQPR